MNVIVASFLSLYSIALWLSVLSVLTSGVYGGDLFDISIGGKAESHEIIVMGFIMQLIMVLLYLIFVRLSKVKVYFGSLNCTISSKKFGYILFFISVAHIFFVIQTGVGRVFSNATHPLSPIFSLTNPAAVFYFYYLLSRQSVNKLLFFINVILFFSLQLLKGWTGFILPVFFIELYFLYERKKNKKSFFSNRFVYIIGIPIVVFFIGGAVYKELFFVKNEIRGVAVSDINYIDAVSKLSSRLTNFPVSLATYIEQDKILLNNESNLNELRGFIRPIVPSGVMSDKDFRVLNNYVMTVFFSDYQSNSSVDIGFVMYYYLLFNMDAIDALISVLLSLSLFFVFFCFIKIISENNFNMNLLIFFVMFSFFYTVSNEMVFSRQYLMIFVHFLILIIFGALKINKGIRHI